MPDLLPWILVIAGCFGATIGSFLNVVIWRIPRGESLIPKSRCTHCGRQIRPWENIPVASWVFLRGRCTGCRERISVRDPLVELVTGAAFVGVVLWMLSTYGWPTGEVLHAVAWWLTLFAYLWFVAASIALALVDIDHQRLPDAIVLPSIFVVTLSLCAAALIGEDSVDLVAPLAVLAGAGVLFAFYLVLALLSPRGMGGGDVKLAAAIGAVLGFVGWGALAVGAFCGFLLGALFGVAILLMRRGRRKTRVPFGPFMLAGAWIGILWGERLAGAYLSVVGLS